MRTSGSVLRPWQLPGWKWLFSIQLGLLLLAALTIASIIGTLIDPLERALALVYDSWWYKGLLLMLAVNIGLATWRTISEKVLPNRSARFQRSPQFYKGKPGQTVAYAGDMAGVAAAFARRGFRMAIEGDYGYAWRGKASRWGAPVSHLGLIMVLLGGFVSTFPFVAREGTVTLPEGGETSEMIPKDAAGQQPQTAPLGFTLRVDNFDTAFFPRTKIPSRFVSTVTVLKSGTPVVVEEPVEVNHAVAVDGWKLHQTSYQPLDGVPRYLVTVNGPGLETTSTLELSPGQQRAIPGGRGAQLAIGPDEPLRWVLSLPGQPIRQGAFASQTATCSPLTLRADQFEPDFVIQDGQPTSRSSDLNNPALKVTLTGDGVARSQWLFARKDLKAMMHGAAGPFALDLVEVMGQPADRRFRVVVRDAATSQSVGQVELALGRMAQVGGTAPQATSGLGGQKPEATAGADDPAHDGWRVRLIGPIQAYATTLTLTRNPAIPFIYLGCAVMLLGLVVAFFIRRREVWFWREASVGRLHVVGNYPQSREDLDPQSQTALAELGQKVH